jgi:hypothetical protein
MAKTPEGRSKNFLFRGLHQNILTGTARDRYAGWIGQIYSEGRYEKEKMVNYVQRLLDKLHPGL